MPDEPTSPRSEIQKEDSDPKLRFAAEQAQLAWVRTSLSMMAFGFVVARFGLFLREIALHDPDKHSIKIPETTISVYIGVFLILVGVVMSVLASFEHYGIIQRINRGEPAIRRKWPMAAMITAALAIIGIAMAGYLVYYGQ